ncbi:hypothetical protein QSJ18_10915 [Gordonia sp. ABSL1-1]|uniref:hypothetical protein n=1 Tax=Gordonia sp. ABSL1-1 TaxID=3053923 RepID=UPI002573AC4E|nr:hypothetical protein [Gordonia sp. ABSL1-1]MDL9937255.1 hypothetical protein [Gordonia sp. ABSL1-1]
MAHHRSSGGDGGFLGRGVSRGLVAAVLCILLVIAAVIAWQKLGDKIDDDATDAAGNCVAGEAMVSVIADADIAGGLETIAKAYNATRPVVGDHCVAIAVRPGDAKITLDALTGTWDQASMGDFPAAWVPQSSVWAADLTTAQPDLVEGQPRSLVSSPVVLATSPRLAEAFGGNLDWSALPTLQRRDGSLGTVGLDGWGSLRMAMPTGAQSDATALAAQAVAAQITRTTGVLTTQDASSNRVASSVRALTRNAPASPDGSPAGAAQVIADGSADPATTEIHVVPITEQRLYQLTKSDTTARLAEVLPLGPTPIADFPVIRLKGERVPEYASDAVAEFIEFAAKAEQLEQLTRLGFRGDAPRPSPTSTVTFPRTPNPMPTPETGAIVAINRLVYPG